jgi:hypothetical protein
MSSNKYGITMILLLFIFSKNYAQTKPDDAVSNPAFFFARLKKGLKTGQAGF